MIEFKRPLKVFLCHAHADRDPVRGLYARRRPHLTKRVAQGKTACMYNFLIEFKKASPAADWLFIYALARLTDPDYYSKIIVLLVFGCIIS